jgi:hypothetical protein
MIVKWTLSLLLAQGLWASAPSAPSELILQPTETTVTLYWQDNADDETGFKIYRDGVYLTTVPADVTHYLDSGLRPHTTYTYIVKATNDTPFSDTALNAPLQIQYHDDTPEFADKDSSDNYRLDDGVGMLFSIKNSDDLKRVELRASKGDEWDLSDAPKSMIASVRIDPSSQSHELTWMQLHHKASGAKPFVRLVWKKADDEGEPSALWAVVRKNEDTHGNVSNWYYLKDFEAGYLYDSEIVILDSESLYINVDGKELYLDIPKYWQDLAFSKQHFYFKAGLYFSGKNSHFAGKVLFEKLLIE